jgi:hypothetical protein
LTHKVPLAECQKALDAVGKLVSVKAVVMPRGLRRGE